MSKIWAVKLHTGDEYLLTMDSKFGDYVPVSYPKYINISKEVVLKHIQGYEKHFGAGDSFDFEDRSYIGFNDLINYLKNKLFRF